MKNRSGNSRTDYAVLALGLINAAGTGLLWLVAPATWPAHSFAIYVGAPAVASVVAIALSAWPIIGSLRAGSATACSND
ncbi:hypothetical protein ACVIGB_001063 [Bradyrhizobium sp. USDA 4341]